MVNHPHRARARFPFHVCIGAAKPCAGFPEPRAAQSYARWLSSGAPLKGHLVEVIAHDGIIGQYTNGEPTGEFRGRGDEHYPAGPNPVRNL